MYYKNAKSRSFTRHNCIVLHSSRSLSYTHDTLLLNIIIFRAFPIIRGGRNCFAYILSTLSYSISPPPLTWHFPHNNIYSLQEYELPLRLVPGIGASNVLLISMCPSSLLLTCPNTCSLFSVIFFFTGATFTDHINHASSYTGNQSILPKPVVIVLLLLHA